MRRYPQFRTSPSTVLPFPSVGTAPSGPQTVRRLRGGGIRTSPLRAEWISASAITLLFTIFRPNSDIAVSGWVGTPSSNLYENIDDTTLSRTDYITSPDVSTPATFGLTSSMVAGAYTVRIDADKTGTTGQIRVRFLNSSSVDVGGSSWQSLTTSATTYTLSATLTGTADRIKIEVQA